MRTGTYIQGSTRPDLHVWWPDPDGNGLADLSGETLTLECGDQHHNLLWQKSAGITVQAGSGTGEKPGDVPNVVVAWDAAGEIGDLPPGDYNLELIGTVAGKDRKVPVRLRILASNR